MRLTLSLGQRLFAATLLSFAVVGGAGVELLRWQFLDNFADAPAPARDPRLDTLAAAIAAQYAAHHDWSFLPPAPAARAAWLREQAARLAAPQGSTAFGERLGLEDSQRRLLAGARPGAWLVAVTSIDTGAVPIEADGQAVGNLVLAHAQRGEDDLAVAFLIQRQGRLGLVALMAMLTCVIASAALAARFRRPVRQLVAGARALEAGRFDARLPQARGDELGMLAQAFNTLAAKLGDAERARVQWMADTSHELRTPLAVLRGQLEAVQDGVRDATPAHVDAMLAQVQALTRLVDDLQALTPAPLACRPMDPWPLVADAVAAFETRMQEAGVSLRLAPPPAAATIAGDPDRLRQVIANLLENGARHTDAGGRVEVAASVAGGQWRLTLDDSAPGVPPDALPRLGERFFRVDPSRTRRSGGSGLGLAVCRRIVEAHGGQLRFEASPLGGLRAIVTLPLGGGA